jgi:hypothetical protein
MEAVSKGGFRPVALDALVAVPEHHILLFENDAVRVLETRIALGSRTPIHTHCYPGVVYILKQSSIVRRDDGGEITFDARLLPPVSKPSPESLPPLGPHSIENVGEAEVWAMSVELKRRLGKTNNGGAELCFRRMPRPPGQVATAG